MKISRRITMYSINRQKASYQSSIDHSKFKSIWKFISIVLWNNSTVFISILILKGLSCAKFVATWIRLYEAKWERIAWSSCGRLKRLACVCLEIGGRSITSFNSCSVFMWKIFTSSMCSSSDLSSSNIFYRWLCFCSICLLLWFTVVQLVTMVPSFGRRRPRPYWR